MASEVFLVRHGPTEWSSTGRHTSVTDLPLLPEGEDAARALAPRLSGRAFELVLTSPRRRARDTAAQAGFADAEVDADLVEWAYGRYEGITTEDIRRADPSWTIWQGHTPDGETAASVTERTDRVLDRIRAVPGRALLFGHGHALRALASRWLERPVADGRYLTLDTATISVLADHRGQPVLQRWNA